MKQFYFFLSFLFFTGLSAQSFEGTNGIIPDDLTTVTFTAEANGLPSSTDTLFFGIEQVCLDIVHPWNSDLKVRLMSPSGKVVTLIEGIGGDQDNFTNTCLHGNSQQSIFNGYAPFTGAFRPIGDLGSINDGSNPNGTWSLIINDVYPQDAGTLLSWNIQFGPNPSKSYSFESTRLPIVKIETNNQTIVDDPKIAATLSIISNENGDLNYVNSTDYSFSGPIGIEHRGSSSQSFPKKSFGIETWDEVGEDKDVSLLGMPEESDWVLNAHYADKSLLRNVMTYELFNRMGHYAPRTRLVEVFINNEYKGIYALMEKVKRNKNRVDISKLTPEDNTGSDVTGGYIFKVDRPTGSGTGGWTSKIPVPGKQGVYTNFLFEYPKDDEITDSQKYYLQSFVDSFENALIGEDYQNPVSGWRKYADEKSFIDFMLMQEMSKNVDAYRLSTFLFKNKDTKDNKIHFGPVWDFDIAWNNADFCEAFITSDWAFNINYKCPDGISPFWWEKIITDTTFMANMRCRYESLRQDILSEASIQQLLDEKVESMDGAFHHNFYVWSTLGIYIWPNTQPIPTTYAGEVDKLKGWIHNRFQWLDYIINISSPDVKIDFTASHSNGLNWSFTAIKDFEGEYLWDFGDGSTSSNKVGDHTFNAPGTYNVTLKVKNPYGCENSYTEVVNIVNLENKSLDALNVEIYPNPAKEILNINIGSEAEKVSLVLTDMSGKTVLIKDKFVSGKNSISLNHLSSGTYLCTITKGSKTAKVKINHM